ncbi:MAG: phosphoserine phosphatase RsbU/P [Solirubrobacteraceae bacterium]|nr:phosphoserine phosphatase RsbU/P [Solirubrobacteraceae bacterium]
MTTLEEMDIAAPHVPASSPVPPGAASGEDDALDQLLRQIISGLFVLTDGQGALSKWSDPAELLFGLPAEEALGEPFFGRLVEPAGLSPEADTWRKFVETGELPGARGRLELDANRPGGGQFRMESVFVPVKLDEGFDFSLFLEDLSFELPIEMMLMRMRQQHPVVITALRQALADERQPWEGWRTAGTLIAFRPLVPTPWMEDAMARREADAAAAEEELQSRIQMYEAPDVQGTDVYDLEDARAVIDRLKWATERIEDLEERSRIMEGAAAQAADAQLRAQAAERAALDAKAELAERPVGAAGEAERLELLARVERVERAAEQAAGLAAEQGRIAEIERSRAAELEAQRTELLARLDALEHDAAGATRDAHAAVDAARAELAERMAALEQAHGAAEEAAAQAARDALLERIEAVEAGVEEASARDDAAPLRDELRATLARLEQLSEETARLRAHVDAPGDVTLSDEDRRRLEDAHREAEEARAAIETLRAQAEELRSAHAEARDEAGRLQARLNELADGDGQARHDVDALRREHDEIRGWLEDARRERDEARQQVRDALRGAEEARAALEREAREAPARAAAAASESEVSAFVDAARGEFHALHEQAEAARARLDVLTTEAEEAARRADEARAEAAAARGETAEVREEARDAQRTAREAAERIDLVDRGAANVLDEIKASNTVVEEIAALARSAQQDASESRADAGEARAVVARLEQLVTAAREQAEHAAGEAAGAREQAAAAEASAASARELAAGVGDISHAVATEVVATLTDEVGAHRDAIETLRDDGAVRILSARLDALESAPAVPDGLEARIDSLRDSVAGAMGRLESLATEFAATRTESGVSRTNLEQRLAEAAAELMAARTDAEQACRGLDDLREELGTLREEAAAARAAAHEPTASNDDAIEELRSEMRAALATMGDLRKGFDEARQAAVAARRDADAARAAAEKVGAVNEATSEKFTEVWKQMLTAGPRPESDGRAGLGRPPQQRVAPKKAAPPARPSRPGFDDDPRPMAVLDLKGRFTQLNPAFSKLVGYKEHEFGKATWPSVLDRGTYKEQTDEMAAIVAGEQRYAEVQSTYMHGQGLMVLIKGEIRLQSREDGEPESLLMVVDPTGAGGSEAS